MAGDDAVRVLQDEGSPQCDTLPCVDWELDRLFLSILSLLLSTCPGEHDRHHQEANDENQNDGGKGGEDPGVDAATKTIALAEDASLGAGRRDHRTTGSIPVSVRCQGESSGDITGGGFLCSCPVPQLHRAVKTVAQRAVHEHKECHGGPCREEWHVARHSRRRVGSLVAQGRVALNT